MQDPAKSLPMARVTLAVVPIILVLGAIAGPAQAQVEAQGGARHDENRASVRYADLDLTSPEGRATLDKRLERAIRNVCRTRFSRSVRVANESRQCFTDTRRKLADKRRTAIANARALADRQAAGQP